MSQPPPALPPGLSSVDCLDRLRAEGASRYHDRHPFNVRMHAGELPGK